MKKGTPQRTLRDRFESNVPDITSTGCWEWAGARFVSTGYGMLNVRSSVDGKWRPTTAHRVAYELLVGDIPDGLVIDHLCRNHACVNPAHLEAVPQQTNLLRGEHPSAIAARRHASSGTCAAPDCIAPPTRKDHCEAHYGRLLRTGSPTGSTRKTLAERIEQHVRRDGDGCWIWTGRVTTRGYPRIGVGKATLMVQRVVYETVTGVSLQGARLWACPKSMVCVNPDHVTKQRQT